MGQKILLINPMKPPSKRRKVTKSSLSGGSKMAAARKRRRTPAQIAATKRLVAANKRRRKIGSRTAVKRRRNPIGSSDAAAYRSVARMDNPRRRKRRSVAASTPRRRVRRRNPIQPAVGMLMTSLNSSLWGAGGAVAVDAVVAMLPLPDAMRTGYVKHLVKGAASALLGQGAGYVVDRKHAAAMAAGGLTVALHAALTDFVKENVPALSLGFYNASLPATRANLGAYVSGGADGVRPQIAASAPGTGGAQQLGAYVSGAQRYQGRGRRG